MKNKAFTLTEVLVYISVAFVVISAIVGFVFWLVNSNHKNRIARETANSAKRAMEIMDFEIKNAKAVYAPTTLANQLSLESVRYLPEGEISSYVDFYLCGIQLCLKKESQDPIVLTPESLGVSNLNFTYIKNGSFESVKINLTLDYKNPSGRPEYNFSYTLNSAVSLRSY